MISKKSQKGFTLIEVLVVVSIIGFLVTSAFVVFNVAQMGSRDTARMASIDSLRKALNMYLNEKAEFPVSTGECLNGSDGVGKALIDNRYIENIPQDPLWPFSIPAMTNGIPNPGENKFCYYYYNNPTAAADPYFLMSYYLESDTKSGKKGINIMTYQKNVHESEL